MLDYESSYTANQPLFYGPIYMWNRYSHVRNLVWMPEAQYTKFGHQSRIDLHNGMEPQRINVPLKDRAFKPIYQVEVNDFPRWMDKHLRTLQAVYNRFPSARQYLPSLEEYLQHLRGFGTVTLGQLNLQLYRWVARQLVEHGWREPKNYNSMELLARPEDPSEWVAAMGLAIGAKEYLGGGTAQAAYLKEEHFKPHGMRFVAQDYLMMPYRRGAVWQNDGNICVLDPLLTQGASMVIDLISQPCM